jgi:hypothetical protein
MTEKTIDSDTFSENLVIFRLVQTSRTFGNYWDVTRVTVHKEFKDRVKPVKVEVVDYGLLDEESMDEIFKLYNKGNFGAHGTHPNKILKTLKKLGEALTNAPIVVNRDIRDLGR